MQIRFNKHKIFVIYGNRFENMGIKVIVGISGGVDSSVSALILKNQGFSVTGAFMKNWEEDDSDDYCSSKQDINDAISICKQIDIPFQKINFSDEYWSNVFEKFLGEYKIGLTPNPDILCNKEIKFKSFLNYGESLGGNYIATGHYARKRLLPNGEYQLLKGSDLNKDQSYFLYTLTQNQLGKVVFPLGELSKLAVRKIAKVNQLVTHDKKDSTGICFIGKQNFKAFLSKYLSTRPGKIHDEYDVSIGTHDGLAYYTIGQRQGLGIGGKRGRLAAAWFVAEKDLERNLLIAVQGNNHPLLFKKSLYATKLHWISGKKPSRVFSCAAKIRYRQTDQKCCV